ncbi:MAG TPA: alpha/beta fold hydrolase [Vicinamibacterales bacterium]|nr:alpha/beta fold hydrolase [Vicinamibacterales bacterium]
MRRALPAALVLVFALPAAAQRTHRVSFRAADGALISATFFEPSRRPAPAVILLHMLTRNRRDWEPVAGRLAADGIAALAIDFRGHGESPPSADDSGVLTPLIKDVAAARQYLASRPDVQADRIGLAGASLGANVAVTYAAGDPAVRSLALLSPTMDYRGIRIDQHVRKYSPRPMLLVASREDAYALRTLRDLVKADKNGSREQIVLDEAGHGTRMLSRAGDLVRMLVEWFHRTL